MIQTCQWCGKSYDETDLMRNHTMRNLFCSTRCRQESKGGKSGKSGSSSGGGQSDGVIKTALKGAVRGKTAEEKIAETELEQEKLRMEHELELRRLDEKKEKRQIKQARNERWTEQADRLREDGRPFAAFITKNQYSVITGSIIGLLFAYMRLDSIYIPVIVFSVFGIGAYMYFKEKNKSS